ncbi:hypothetical protein F2Q69_00035352 [Brassica cretica]|uniref:Uncharacterized protein n=1 Tax=Brassica cretica TaxID=69181 RepID=A0A8S9SG47_BRACR|nr:hypothetical protein F2Q69_00035352 [Brassica cretica]
MVAIVILRQDENENLYDQDGHLCNATDDDFWQVVMHEKLGEGDFEVESSLSFGGSQWCRPMSMDAHRSTDQDEDRSLDYSRHRSTLSAESTAECSAVRIMTHEEFTEKHPHPPSPFYIKIDVPHEPAIDRQRETDIDRPPSPPIDRRTPLTYRVRLLSIDSNQINALRPPPKPLANPPEPTTNPSDTTPKPMQVDEATEGRVLRKRKEKIPKHLKREANEKEMDGFTKRVLRIPVEKHFDEVYYTHRLWMFFRETETEEDIRKMFHYIMEMMKLRITLKKKSDPGKFAIPCMDENGNLYDQDGHLRNATSQKLDAQGNVILDDDATRAAQPVEEVAPPKALADYNRLDEYYANRSAIRLPEIQKQNFELKPQPPPKPLANPPEPTTNPSDTTPERMQVDEATEERVLRKRKEETKETEEDIRRMFHHVRERMKLRITLKKKSDPGKFAIPCLVKGIEFPHALCDTGASVSILPKVSAPSVRVPASGSRVPAPSPGSLPLGLGPASGHGSQSPSLGPSSVFQANYRAHEFDSRQGYISPREDLLLREVYDRLIPAITTMKMTSYALCSTPTTPHTGPGHDLQLTDKDTPCSSKHIEAPCSLHHIDYSTICSGHAPPRTDEDPQAFTMDRQSLPNDQSPPRLLRHRQHILAHTRMAVS